MPRLALPAALALGLVACRDLDYQPPNGQNRAPRVRFQAPDAREPLSVSPFVALEADDPNGVHLVSVSCQSGLLRTWTQPPFSGQVDLTPCLGQAARDGGAALVPVALVAEAVDGLGARGEARLTVTVDRTQAIVRVSLPPSIQPGAQVSFELSSDVALAAPPSVQVDGLEADVTANAADPGRRFTVQFGPAPLLGADRFPDAGELPFEVLEETSRPLGVAVRAVTRLGNVTRLELSTQVSRVLWTRTIPGGLTVNGASAALRRPLRPVGTAQGLAVHQPIEGQGAFWLPGYLRTQDGAHQMPLPELLPGWFPVSARAIDSRGRTLFQVPLDGGTHRLAFGGQARESLDSSFSVAGFGPRSSRLWTTGDAICQELSSEATGCQFTIECLESDGGVRRVTTSPSGEYFEDSEAILRSGESVLALPSGAPQQSCCGSQLCLPRGVLFGSLRDKGFASKRLPQDMSVERALAIGDGTFVLVGRPDGGGATQFVHMVPSGADAGRYLEQADASVLAEDVVAALPDGSLLIVRRLLPLTHTYLELWAPGARAPSASTRLPGFWAYVPGEEAALAQNVVVDPATRSFYLLLRSGASASPTYSVAAFDRSLRPRWIYRYAGAGGEVQRPPMLVGDEPGSLIYLVDPQGQRAVAFAR